MLVFDYTRRNYEIVRNIHLLINEKKVGIHSVLKTAGQSRENNKKNQQGNKNNQQGKVEKIIRITSRVKV
ncbi:hypothetical protein NUSPORA_01216 [Nucleospora cyclopteri]